MKLLFASPTYGPVDSQALRSQRAAIMHAANNGIKWMGDISPERMKFDTARDYVAKHACDTDADFVFWCDSDIVLPVDAITVLCHRAAEGRFHFLSGIYFQRVFPHWPLVANRTAAGTFQWLVKWPDNTIFPADGCGFGCALTSVEMLKAIGQLWFNYEQYSEDFDFCMKAKARGYQLMVDGNVQCGHLADPSAVTITTFQQSHPELFGGDSEASQTGSLRGDG